MNLILLYEYRFSPGAASQFHCLVLKSPCSCGVILYRVMRLTLS